MKEIIKLNFGTSKDNYDEEIEINGIRAHIRGVGADYNFELARSLVEKYANECDAIAISGFILDVKLGKKVYVHQMVKELRKVAKQTPLLDGNMLRKAVFPWALKKYIDQNKHFLSHKKISFYTGIVQWNYLSFFEEHASKLVFGDMFFTMGVPVALHGLGHLENFLRVNSPILSRLKLKNKVIRDFSSIKARTRAMKSFFDSDIFVVNESQMEFIKLNDLSGKTVIIDRLSPDNQERIFQAGADKIINLFPVSKDFPEVAAPVIEALLYATHPDQVLSEEDILNYIQDWKIKPEEIVNPYPKGGNGRFAFVIHPLSKNQIAQIPGLEFLKDSPMVDLAEKLSSFVPGYHYCTITGIKSEFSGKEVIGDLFLLPLTPKMLLSSPVEKVYHSLVNICHDAHNRGAKVIGLGAYTKIVGDAGVTVNQRSPIPLTTGNSLSSASTLWAASFGIEKMGLVKKKDGRYEGTCIVIGATGSIGKICAKVLSRQWKRIVVVAPRPYKVLELVEQLKEFAPDTEIIGTTNPNTYTPQADLIITSTSAQGEKIIDIELVKPGCVICDVSRPFDISLEEAAKRPDVLIIASGELELPGDVKIGKTIGLHGEAVYACLAETAILAMEGLHESFSLSRELSYERLVQIDRLARKHGIKLAGIMGHTGEIKENEIDLCRRYAIEKISQINPL